MENNIWSKLTTEEKEKLISNIHDYKLFQTTESEAKKGKESCGKTIKEIFEKYGFSGTTYIEDKTVTYKEQTKRVADNNKIKELGLWLELSTEQTTKPLSIR